MALGVKEEMDITSRERDKILTDRAISGHICSDQKGRQLIFLFRVWDLEWSKLAGQEIKDWPVCQN